MALRIRLFGAFELEGDGAVVQLPARKSEALLSVLALRPGVAFSREWLSALLWPDVPESQARTSLRQAVGHLRKVLDERLLVGSTDRLHLQPGVAWIDSAELEQIAARPPQEREELAELVRGPLLDGFPAIEQPFADWLMEERARFAERAAARLEECLAALSAAGFCDRAIAVGARLVELEPSREGVHRALMRLELERGDRAAALRRYERCREALERRLGIAPSAETERLRALIAAETAEPSRLSAPRAAHGLPDLEGRLRVAVVPFRAEPDTDAARLLATGLGEDVTTELARFRQLALIARGSVAEVAARTTSPEAIGAETGARLVVSGSVRVAGDRARITAALTDTTTGLELWAERWDTALEDPFVVIDRLTRSLVSALALRIDEARLRTTLGRPREQLEAYECWLRGLECLRQGTLATDEEARGFFERALAVAPGFARAHSGISLSHFNDWSCQAWERWDEREQKSFESARRAVELDDSDHVTHTILARIHVYRGEFALGERHVERALSLNANDADMLLQASIALAQLGDGARATELAATALALNPKRPDWYFPAVAFAHLVARAPERALQVGLEAPDALVDGRAHLASAAAHLGDLGAAREHVTRFIHNFRCKIVPTREIAAGEPVNWLRRVTPFRRPSDTEYVLGGLARAGLEVG